MFATIRRIALAVAGAAALIAAGRARGDPDQGRWQPPWYGSPAAVEPRAHAPPAHAPPYLPAAPARFSPEVSLALALPAPPAFLAMAPPAYPVHGAWTRHELAREYRWLDLVRARFYRRAAWNPWRARQFEVWYQARRAVLDRCWTAMAGTPGHRDWRSGGGDGWRWERWESRDD